MKKFIAILFSAMLVFGLAASVYAADLKFGGDAYVEGVMRDGYDMDGTNEASDDYRFWGQRVRLKFDAILENGIEVRTRLRVSDSVWDGTGSTKYGDTGYSRETATAFGGGYTGAAYSRDNTANDSVTPDYAYLHVPVGPVTIDAGHQLLSWGLGLWVWNQENDQIFFTHKLNDTTTLGGFVQKNTELIQGDNEGDKDSYAVFVKAKPSDMSEVGFITVYSQDQPNDTAQNDAFEGQDGWQFDLYGTTKMGAITLMSEMAYKTGYMFASSTETRTVGGATYTHHNGYNSQFGGKLAAVVDMSPITLTGAFAMATGKFVTDNDFKPTFFFGSSENPLSIMDFQSLDEDRTTWAVVTKGSYKISDTMTAGATAAYADFGLTSDDGRQDGRGDHFSLTELDASFEYQIAKSTKYMIGAAYGIPLSVPETMSMTDDNIFGVFHKLAISF